MGLGALGLLIGGRIFYANTKITVRIRRAYVAVSRVNLPFQSDILSTPVSVVVEQVFKQYRINLYLTCYKAEMLYHHHHHHYHRRHHFKMYSLE